jgi:hypothetical protein
MFYRGAVTGTFLLFPGLVAASLVLDGLVRPRRDGDARWPLRSAAGMVLHMLLVASGFGLFLAICGNPLASAILTLALVALFTVVSNAKHTMLGEPLVFTDLVLVGAVLRHPQFYLSALSPVQKAVLIASGPALLALFAWLFVGDLGFHLAGALLLAAVWCCCGGCWRFPSGAVLRRYPIWTGTCAVMACWQPCCSIGCVGARRPIPRRAPTRGGGWSGGGGASARGDRAMQIVRRSRGTVR